MSPHFEHRNPEDGSTPSRKIKDTDSDVVDATKSLEKHNTTSSEFARKIKGSDEATQRLGSSRRHGQQRKSDLEPFVEIDEVVGWIAVLTGSGRGKSFPLRGENNRISREAGFEILLNFDDKSISRNVEATIVFDSKRGMFTLVAGDGMNRPRHNGEQVLSPQKLSAYDRITVGRTELIFIPLCGEKFRWSNSDGFD